MTRRGVVIGGAALIGAAFAAIAITLQQDDDIVLQHNDAEIVASGQAVYDTYCASCHGVNLEGQENWRSPGADGRLPAPPHDETGHTWHHNGHTLFGLTKYGVAAAIGDPDYASNMPIYDGVLSDDEIIAVLSYIKSTWPAEIRARHDAMERR
ncbi:c-type cytochrome [Primorskyibacter sp. S187A]|uniref:c-type cytochrome n=1 Tax=Primorskyibacter sp. S187A TaxID=3415130 RepID=UPI003C7B569B